MNEPLELMLRRRWFTALSTIGTLACDAWSCFTLEDRTRNPDEAKVMHQTAIPRGRYRVLLTPSPRFGRVLPILEKVPNFTGIRIHPGNTATDTSGCILVGLRRHENRISQSRSAFDELFKRLIVAASHGREIWISITEDPEDTEA